MNLETLALVAVVLAAIPAMMFLWNLPQLKAPGGRVEGALPPVSILIPARNESANLRGALSAVLSNRGAEFEVIVLDDHSEDDTAAIVREFMTVDTRVRLETAPPLPTGWCGKQHACHVLARHARHPLLLFVDADVRLAPDALTRLCACMSTEGVVNRKSQILNPPALASGVPRQYTDTFLEKLLIPLIHFVLLGFLPMWRMRHCAKPAYGAGCGQLFVARADAYHAVGGHAAIRDSLHDGLKLPRAFRRAGYRTDLFDATDVASCRMYHTGAEVVAGLLKNAHEGLATPAQIGPWTMLLLGGHILPWLLLAASPWIYGRAVLLASLAVALSLLPRLLAAWRFKQSWLGAALHPFGVAVFLGIQWMAFIRSFQRRPATWKGRSYPAKVAPATSATPLRPRPENAMAGK
jgi:glycosyltransferase involved in cell wall biosynthesis